MINLLIVMHLYILYRYSKDVRVLIREICPASNNRYDMVYFILSY